MPHTPPVRALLMIAAPLGPCTSGSSYTSSQNFGNASRRFGPSCSRRTVRTIFLNRPSFSNAADGRESPAHVPACASPSGTPFAVTRPAQSALTTDPNSVPVSGITVKHREMSVGASPYFRARPNHSLPERDIFLWIDQSGRRDQLKLIPTSHSDTSTHSTRSSGEVRRASCRFGDAGE
jgi:hypothetical protein